MSSNDIVDRGRQVSGPTTSGLRRVTVVTQVHHHADSGETVGVETYKSVECRSDDSPVKRTMTVGPDWTPLNFFWAGVPSVVVLVNEPTTWFHQPTVEQREADKGRILVLGVCDGQSRPVGVCAVPPGNSLTFTPLPNRDYVIRSADNTTCRVTQLVCPS